VPDVPVCPGATSVGTGAAASGAAGAATPVAGTPATSTPTAPATSGAAPVAAPPASSTKQIPGGLDLGWLPQGLGLLAVLGALLLVYRRLWPRIGAGRDAGQDGGDGS
jgi:hypothetical protein